MDDVMVAGIVVRPVRSAAVETESTLASRRCRRYTELAMLTVRGVAFRAMKDRARGPWADVLSDAALAVWRAAGVDPGDHSTCPLHPRGCDGTGPPFGFGCCGGDHCRQLDVTRFVRLCLDPGWPA